MRLRKVATGHRWPEKLKLKVARLVMGMEAPDVVKMLLYRRAFFGGPFSAVIQEAMRAPSEWSIGERELLAAFVSKVNQCPF